MSKLFNQLKKPLSAPFIISLIITFLFFIFSFFIYSYEITSIQIIHKIMEFLFIPLRLAFSVLIIIFDNPSRPDLIKLPPAPFVYLIVFGIYILYFVGVFLLLYFILKFIFKKVKSVKK